MARLAELESALINAHKAGDQRGAQIIANAILEKRRSLGMQDDGTYALPNPAEGGNAFLAGVGKGMVDIGRGIGQTLGMVSREDVAEARRLDRPLMETAAGKVGNVVGTAAMLAPTALIPGANTMAGAAAIGAGTGVLAPSESTEETLRNTALGGVLGPVGLAVGRGVAAGYQGAKSLIQPFFRSGQEQIASKTLQSFATNPQQAAANLRSARPLVRGSRPTMAEAASDPGLAQLQRTLANDPNIGGELAARAMANNAARAEALSRIAGDEGKRTLFETMRETTAQQLYGKAFKQKIPPKKWEKAQDQVAELMKRPSMQLAQERARQIAAEEGTALTEDGSVRGLHYLKKALDDMLDAAKDTGIGNVQKRAIAKTRDELIGVIDYLSPKYAQARAEYADISKKIAQMEVGKELKDKAFPAITDFGGSTRVRTQAYAEALRNADATARRATGFKGATLEGTMTPLQQKRLKQVAQDLARKVNAEEAGKAFGSNTAQNLVSQNVLRSLLGPTGLPQSWAENTLLMTAMRPIQFASKIGEEGVRQRLAAAALDPRLAADLLMRSQQRGLLEAAAPEVARYLPATGLLMLPTQ